MIACACRYGSYDALQILVKRGARLIVENEVGAASVYRPLQVVASQSEPAERNIPLGI